MNARTFESRYLFKGQLVLKTGLHIGGGEPHLSISDGPIIRTADGQPFIPGSSFKGAFRSTVEKLTAVVGLCSCWLEDEAENCLTAQKGKVRKAYQELRGYRNRSVSAQRESDKEARNALDSLGCSDWIGVFLTDKHFLQLLHKHLCHTCKLFGSPYAASKINFSDLYLYEPIEGIVQVRDGVAIDRDSERAKEQLLYNYEVVSPTVAFELEILLENPTNTDLQLTCLGLTEFLSGFGGLGGKRSRGLGRCKLRQLQIYVLDLSVDDVEERAQRLRQYLLGKTLSQKMMQVPDTTKFLEQQIIALVNRKVERC